MADIVVYSKDYCPFCKRAKALLARKGAAFTEIEVSNDPERLAEMIQRSHGRRTVPQIFIDAHHIGGSDELAALEADGKLDGLLNRAVAA